MTGKPAFPADELDLEEKILRSEYKVPLQLTPECRDLIAKLIVANPDHRLNIK